MRQTTMLIRAAFHDRGHSRVAYAQAHQVLWRLAAELEAQGVGRKVVGTCSAWPCAAIRRRSSGSGRSPCSAHHDRAAAAAVEESNRSATPTWWTRGAPIATIVVVALAVRVPHLAADVWADEAWYYHLARTWGSEARWVQPPDDVGAQLAYRPLFFVLFWPLAQFGLTAARLGNLAASIALVLATFRLARVQGVPTSLAMVAALVVSLNAACAQFSVILTTDNVAALGTVLAVTAALQRRYRHASALMSAAVLCKESVIAVACATFVGSLIAEWWKARAPDDNGDERRPEKTRAHFLLAIPLVLVAVTQALGMLVFKGRMPGWGPNAGVLAFLEQYMSGFAAIPFAIVLLARKRFVLLAAAGALPLFYIAWTLVLGRGVEIWYGVSMLPLVAPAYAVALNDLRRWIHTRYSLATTVDRVLPSLALAVLAPWSPWPPWRIHPDAGVLDVARVIEAERPRKVAMASCFWSFAYFPWRPPGTTVVKRFPLGAMWSTVELSELREAASDADLMVFCPPAIASIRAGGGGDPECRVFENEQILVLRGPSPCAKRRAGGRDRRQDPVADSAEATVLAAPAPSGSQADPTIALRRLTQSDMQWNACTALGPDGVARGRDCAGPFPMFGPYLSAPAGSVLQISFDLQAHREGAFGLDVVSNAGQALHGARLPELLRQGDVRRFSYRVVFTESAENVETRLVLTGSGPYDFDVSNLRVALSSGVDPSTIAEPQY